MSSQLNTFDVFLCHNNSDTVTARQLFDSLESSYGLKVWFDDEELPPGIPWQPLLEKGIRESTAVAVLIGQDGIGPWQNEEMQAALVLAVRDGRRVIPTLLPTAPHQPELPLFLGLRTWVDFRGGFQQGKLDKLVWGITGVKPHRSQPRKTQPTEPQTRPKYWAALKLWEEKLEFLQEQEAISSSPNQRFELKKLIEQAKHKIRQFGGES